MWLKVIIQEISIASYNFLQSVVEPMIPKFTISIFKRSMEWHWIPCSLWFIIIYWQCVNCRNYPFVHISFRIFGISDTQFYYLIVYRFSFICVMLGLGVQYFFKRIILDLKYSDYELSFSLQRWNILLVSRWNIRH